MHTSYTSGPDGVRMAIGGRLVELERATSTNAYAAEHLALGNLEHGTVVLAHEQTAGRGQRGRVWRSAPGLDLTFTLVVTPRALRAEAQFSLARITALAMLDAVSPELGGHARVKWPNDILVEDRKLAGILIQNELQGERITGSMIGVGINVNSRTAGWEPPATSLLLETGRPHDRRGLLDTICRCMQARWERWEANGDDGTAEYLTRLWGRGEERAFELDGEAVRAVPVDVDILGRLVVRHGDGGTVAYGMDRLRFAPR